MSDFIKKLKAAAAGVKTHKVTDAVHSANHKLSKWTDKIKEKAKLLFPHAGRD
jgi:phage tail protein X